MNLTVLSQYCNVRQISPTLRLMDTRLTCDSYTSLHIAIKYMSIGHKILSKACRENLTLYSSPHSLEKQHVKI
jgi:hypothetical protein